MRNVFLVGLCVLTLSATAHGVDNKLIRWSDGQNTYQTQILQDIKVMKSKIRHLKRYRLDCRNGFDEALEVEGDIDDDAVRALTELVPLLKKCWKGYIDEPSPIYLNSPGGAVKEGTDAIRALIKHEVHTFVRTNHKCGGLCPYLFLSGKKRTMLGSAELEFRAPLPPGGGCYNPRDPKVLSEQVFKHGFNQFDFLVHVLGQENATFVFNRAVSPCTFIAKEVWSLNRDASELFGLTTH